MVYISSAHTQFHLPVPKCSGLSQPHQNMVIVLIYSLHKDCLNKSVFRSSVTEQGLGLYIGVTTVDPASQLRTTAMLIVHLFLAAPRCMRFTENSLDDSGVIREG
jgi:hypothetical protein